MAHTGNAAAQNGCSERADDPISRTQEHPPCLSRFVPRVRQRGEPNRCSGSLNLEAEESEVPGCRGAIQTVAIVCAIRAVAKIAGNTTKSPVRVRLERASNPLTKKSGQRDGACSTSRQRDVRRLGILQQASSVRLRRGKLSLRDRVVALRERIETRSTPMNTSRQTRLSARSQHRASPPLDNVAARPIGSTLHARNRMAQDRARMRTSASSGRGSCPDIDEKG